MIAAWAAEGVGSCLVARVPGRVPGLYVIDVDERGERSFRYWRSAAPVRELFDLPAAAGLAERLANYSLVYLSGITLSLFNDHGRARLFGLLDGIRAHGVQIAFDGNFRSRGWPDPAVARQVFTEMLARTDIALPTFSDEAVLFGDADAEATASRIEACAAPRLSSNAAPRPAWWFRGRRGSGFPLKRPSSRSIPRRLAIALMAAIWRHDCMGRMR